MKPVHFSHYEFLILCDFLDQLAGAALQTVFFIDRVVAKFDTLDYRY